MFFSSCYPRSDLKLLLKHKTNGESRRNKGIQADGQTWYLKIKTKSFPRMPFSPFTRMRSRGLPGRPRDRLVLDF